MDALTDDTTGSFLVSTANGSRYELDLDQRVLRRVAPNGRGAEFRLRRDGDIIELVELVHCRRGSPMVLLIDLAEPGVAVTSRESTPVVSIEQASALPPGP